MPDAFFREECDRLGFALPPFEQYAVGMVFLPRDPGTRQKCIDAFYRVVPEEGQILLGWRDVPTDNSRPGLQRQADRADHPPGVHQARAAHRSTDAFQRKLFVIRKQVHHAVWGEDLPDEEQFYICSLSPRTIVYKGMILAGNLSTYYLDLQAPTLVSALALVHQRFSTNTFPSWKLAHPFRYLCHNGEINTLRGNINWMLARRHPMKSDLLEG